MKRKGILCCAALMLLTAVPAAAATTFEINFSGTIDDIYSEGDAGFDFAEGSTFSGSMGYALPLPNVETDSWEDHSYSWADLSDYSRDDLIFTADVDGGTYSSPTYDYAGLYSSTSSDQAYFDYYVSVELEDNQYGYMGIMLEGDAGGMTAEQVLRNPDLLSEAQGHFYLGYDWYDQDSGDYGYASAHGTLDAFDFSGGTVPEPVTFMLLVIGGVGVAFRRP